jgi:HlyD family secretion protein
LAAAILLIVGANYFLQTGPQKIDFYTGRTEIRTIVESVSATGSAEPLEVYYVQSEILGVVDQVLATYNDEVSPGQVLAKISSDIQRVKLESALADLEASESAEKTAAAGVEAAQAAKKAAEAELDAARRMYEEAKTSFETTPPLIPKTKLDAQLDLYKKAQAGLELAQSQVHQAAANLEAAHSKVESARVGIKAAQLEISKAELKSPASGIVLNVNCRVGDTVGRPKLNLSEPSPALFEIASPLNRMRAIVRVSEVDYSRVKVGQPVRFTVDAYPDDPFEGRVVQIRNSANAERTAVAYDTVVEFDNRRDERTGEWMVRPRATCRADVLIRSVEGVLAAPNDALLFSPPPNVASIPETQSGESLVWVLRPNGALEPRRVRTGVSDGFWTEILSGELEAGEVVVTGVPASSQGIAIPKFGG